MASVITSTLVFTFCSSSVVVLARYAEERDATVGGATIACQNLPHPPPATEPAPRRAARYAWALLLARLYAVFPLVCPRCGADMRIMIYHHLVKRERANTTLFAED